MLKGLSKIIGGDPIQKQLDAYSEQVVEINTLESAMGALSDSELQAKTGEFRSRLEAGEDLDDLLVEAFAVVREVAVRTIGLRHFDVQLIGGIALHEGRIAEMKTGEGKTLVATLPLYLNALLGKGVHLITVNDYLARRDARWMGPIYDFLGMSVGILQEASRTEHGRKAFLYDPNKEASQEDIHQMLLVDRKDAYGADITYGTNNEFGFDYLRDNMAQSLEARSQRGHHYAILDEVDNILIDEARTPLIISGPSHEDPETYEEMAKVVKQLSVEDIEINERDRTISLTEIGEDHVERLLGQPLRDLDRPEDITPEQARLLGYLEQGLRAEYLFKRNKDYVVQGGRVIIVDEFTGRLMAGRRWSDGLHQAVEAKEGVAVRQENVTYATITLQNYFRMYEKLAGMTGTALTEAEEFNKIYSVDVIPLPTNLEFIAMLPHTDLIEIDYRENGNKFSYYTRTEDTEQLPVFWRRKDYPDVVYRTEESKLRATTIEIFRRHVLGQPLLVGTTSVELSEKIASRLRAELLQKLAMIMVLRDAYLEEKGIPDDGMRVVELQPLYGPLESLSTALMRPFGKELGLPMNPNRPENLARLASILELGDEHHQRLSEVLQAGVRHNVLNAKKHAEESRIIASAGAYGGVTIATNMAGRGVDIKLGGEVAEEVLSTVNRVLRRASVDDPETLNMEERLALLDQIDAEAIGIYDAEIELFRQFMDDEKLVKQVGGLHVIGSERHESRRIDNQLRGRSSRQGDPGSSQFFLSLEDELMRLFGGSQVSGLMERLNIDDAVPIAHGIVNRTIEQSQTRVEGANFDRRKHLLEYDDVLNQQREVFYSQRNRVFVKDDLTDDVKTMLLEEVESHVETSLADEEGPWRLLAWLEEVQPTFNLDHEEPYPSFMIGLLADQLEDVDDKVALKSALVGLANDSLSEQYSHLIQAILDQWQRALDRMQDQVQQRVDIVDLAIEGLLLDAEEQGIEVNVDELIATVEGAAGLRISIDSDTRRQIQEDPYSFRQTLPDLIEASMGLRVWNGMVRAVEQRLGESLQLEEHPETPIDWDEATETLEAAVEKAWDRRAERLLNEVERDLDLWIEKSESLDRGTKIRLLVQMSYGKASFFDKRTHQRRSVVVARLSYPYYAARFIEDEEPQVVVESVMEHLGSASEVLQEQIGRNAFSQIRGSKLSELDEPLLSKLRTFFGRLFDEFEGSGPIETLPPEIQAQLVNTLGTVGLSDAYRRLLLGVGDRLWVEYLTEMEALRTSIGLEAYGQRDPLVQYKSRAVDLFRQLLASIRAGVVSRMYGVQPRVTQAVAAPQARQRETVPAESSEKSSESGDDAKPKAKRKRRRRRR